MIITSISALYDLKFINFKPEKVFIELPYSTNTSNYSNKYSIAIQSPATINIGTIEINNKVYYCPERLFIEIDKFPLENTIRVQALKNLEEVINPQKVFDIYQKIKNKRRGINKKRVELYLSKNLLLMYDILAQKNIDKTRVIREYIMAMLSKKNYPVSITKGGSAVELFVSFKRSTEDIDMHIGYEDINKIINIITNKEEIIYFKVVNDEILKTNKKIISIDLIPLSRKHKLNELLSDIREINLTMNTIYSSDELNQIIRDYALCKSNLKTIPNAVALVFSREMLLAEKYHTLIYQNKNCTRTKDLIDLVNIYNENIDFNKFKKWLFRKWSSKLNHSLSSPDVISYIKEHKDIELTKIKQNFNDAVKMYNTELNYDDAIKIYLKLSNLIIDDLDKLK